MDTTLAPRLRSLAGLTAGLGSALARAGKFPLVDRGVALVSMAVAIALGATSMNDITVLAHQAEPGIDEEAPGRRPFGRQETQRSSAASAFSVDLPWRMPLSV